MNDLFIGYDEDFYDAIPWVMVKGDYNMPISEWDYAIDPSFTVIAAKLLFRKNNEKVYQEYALPEDETIKAEVLASPELLFYAPELSRFLSLLKKPRLMLKFIRDDMLLLYLSELHRFPEIFVLLEKYCITASQDELAKAIEDPFFHFFLEAAKSYCALNESGKARAYDLICTECSIEALYTIINGFSYNNTICLRYRHINDRVIGDYSFRRIASEKDYDIAAKSIGNEMRYCYLPYYDISPDDGLYAVHTDSNKYIAVLDVSELTLRQIYTQQNISLTDSKLLAAILQWLIEVGFTMEKDAMNEK